MNNISVVLIIEDLDLSGLQQRRGPIIIIIINLFKPVYKLLDARAFGQVIKRPFT